MIGAQFPYGGIGDLDTYQVLRHTMTGAENSIESPVAKDAVSTAWEWLRELWNQGPGASTGRRNSDPVPPGDSGSAPKGETGQPIDREGNGITGMGTGTITLVILAGIAAYWVMRR